MTSIFHHFFVLLARIFMSTFFLWNGLNIIMHWGENVQNFADMNVPLAMPILGAEVFCLILGGLLLIVGFKGRLAAVLLIVFLVPDTFVHSNWLLQFDLAQFTQQSVEVGHFLKNLALLGGLLMVLGFGSGGFSVDLVMGRRRRTL